MKDQCRGSLHQSSDANRGIRAAAAGYFERISMAIARSKLPSAMTSQPGREAR